MKNSFSAGQFSSAIGDGQVDKKMVGSSAMADETGGSLDAIRIHGSVSKRRREVEHDLDCSVSNRKRNVEDNLDVGRTGGEVSSQVLSNVDRAWKYVCKRSVLVSISSTDKATIGKANVRNRGVGEKTIRTEVMIRQNRISVTITKEGRVVQEWIENQKGKLFGFDLEWRPNLRKYQEENKVALLQVSNEQECLLVQMLFLDWIPDALVKFLKDPEKKFAGVGIFGDAKKLQKDYGLVCHGIVELTKLATVRLKSDKFINMGLKKLVMEVLGFDMSKRKCITMSDWSRACLDRLQVEYACKDAWVALALLQKLQ